MTRHTREPRATRTQDRRLVLLRTRPAADQAVPAGAPAVTHPEAARDQRGAA
ncbi:hypothetical protein ACFY7H_01315 [Streptomyces sp. NPDC012794]|uniref:hypothetical protein n=1 Tax=Streptomyces sp. NPDC012794 TaxID=3364850 RepID=UPI0036C827F9